MCSFAHFMPFQDLAGAVWRELCDALLTETSLKFPFALTLSLALFLAPAGGRKMGYQSFHQWSPSLTRWANEGAHVNYYTKKSNYLSRKSGERDRNCDAALCFVLLEQADHKACPRDSLLSLTVG